MRLVSVQPNLLNTVLFRESTSGSPVYVISSPGSESKTIINKHAESHATKPHGGSTELEVIATVIWDAEEKAMKIECDGKTRNGEALFALAFAGEWRFKAPSDASYVWEPLDKEEWKLVRPLKHGESSRTTVAHWHRLTGLRALMKRNAYLDIDHNNVDPQDFDYILVTLIYLLRRDEQRLAPLEYDSEVRQITPKGARDDIAPGTGLGFYQGRGEGHHVEPEIEREEREVERDEAGGDFDVGTEGPGDGGSGDGGDGDGGD
ncbi:hypothetical protein PENSPDRAFT_659841 [Peniophora sp. CONT]|nr:hypothetical protein PENSPDRAFT_659841 [Peniophora sp. CONT]